MMNYGINLLIDYLQCGFEMYLFKGYIDILKDSNMSNSLFIVAILITIITYCVVKKAIDKINKN